MPDLHIVPPGQNVVEGKSGRFKISTIPVVLETNCISFCGALAHLRWSLWFSVSPSKVFSGFHILDYHHLTAADCFSHSRPG